MKKQILSTSIFILILIFVTSYFVIFFSLDYKLSGNKEIYLKINEEYIEEGYTAKIFGKNIRDKVSIKTNLDTSKYGTYIEKYKLNILFFSYTLKRIITVEDNEPPVISLNGKSNIILNANDKYEELGATAYDLGDGDLSSEVTISGRVDSSTFGTYTIEYEVSDSFKNTSKVTRTIEVMDIESPKITLVGEDTVYVNKNKNYVELGCLAQDNYDGDLSSKVSITGSVNTSKLGTYELTYTIKDSSNNESTVKRTVEVISEGKTITKTCNNNSICEYLKENNYNVSLGYLNLVTGENYFYNQNKIYYGASLIKTLDALYLYEKEDLNSTLKTHIKKAIEVSNNSSHAYLVNYIGRSNLKEYGISLGALNTLSGSDNYGNTSVADQVIYMKKVYEVSNTNEEFKNYFLNAKWNYLKVNNIPTMHKYGLWDTVYHESGIILEEEPYILVILTYYGNNNASQVFKNISNKVYEYHLSKKME